jgi:large conductance mechanosensitive channel
LKPATWFRPEGQFSGLVSGLLAASLAPQPIRVKTAKTPAFVGFGCQKAQINCHSIDENFSKRSEQNENDFTIGKNPVMSFTTFWFRYLAERGLTGLVANKLSFGKRKTFGDRMLKEFKEFALKGNVVDLAVGVIIGGAFGKIVESLVNDIIMPVIGALTGGIDFSNMYQGLTAAVTALPAGTSYEKAKEAGATLGYGSFITVAINFLIIAWILFMVVRAMNSMKKAEAAAPAAPTPPPAQEVLLGEIRDLLAKR